MLAMPTRAPGAWPLLKAMCVLACAWGLLAGCGTQGLVGQSLEVPETVWTEIGAADGAVAGKRDGWAWWNRMIAEYDGAFARLTARPSAQIHPAGSYLSGPYLRDSIRRDADLEMHDLLVDQPRLAPYGAGGFAESLSVRYLPPGKPMGLKRRPAAYHGAFGRAWAVSYAAALHEREIALERWIRERHAFYRADELIADSRVGGPKVSRLAEKVDPEPHRRNNKREVWILSGGVFSSDTLPDRDSRR